MREPRRRSVDDEAAKRLIEEEAAARVKELQADASVGAAGTSPSPGALRIAWPPTLYLGWIASGIYRRIPRHVRRAARSAGVADVSGTPARFVTAKKHVDEVRVAVVEHSEPTASAISRGLDPGHPCH